MSGRIYIVVGGLREVYSGPSYYEAAKRFDFFVMNSRGFVTDPKSDFVKGVGQPVQFYIDGEVFEEWIPEAKK